MARLVRFGVSLDRDLLKKFDVLIHQNKYTNRSEAIRDLIREKLVKKEWQENREVTGAIAMIYRHSQRELVAKLMDIQHHYHHNIISTQHIHLDHDNCMEVVVIRGKAAEAEELYNKLKSEKGVKHAGFTLTSTGKDLM